MKTYLLSYPRSGNSWTRYIAECISGKPTFGCSTNSEDVPLCKNTLDDNPLQHVDVSASPILYKSHREKLEGKEGNSLLFITRSPSIVIRRHVGHFSLRGAKVYVKLLNIYHHWEGAKLLIKYEDLLNNPKQNILKLAGFLHIAETKVDDFMKRYEYHKEKSLFLYSDSSSGISKKGDSETEGRLDTVESKKLDNLLLRYLLMATGKTHLLQYFYF